MSAFHLSAQDNVQIISINHLFSEETIREILSEVQEKLEAGQKKWVVDLSDLEYMSSIGINLLLGLMSRSKKKGGAMAIANPSSQVLKLLDMTRLTHVFPLCPNIKAASQVLLQK